MNSAAPDLVRLTTLGDGQARASLMEKISTKLAQTGWPDKDIFGIQMAVEESVSNAFRHGNLNGERGEVEIGWKVTESDFMMEVRDHGEGFDESEIPDPTDFANLENLTGRGLLLMRNYMNEVSFRDGGCTVVMRKSRAPSEG